MNWWGKIIGGATGFMLGGPLGALLGAAVGHKVDQGMQGSPGDFGYSFGRQDRVQTAFFTATFSVMGNVCKADGQVTEDEIDLAKQVMARMELSALQQTAAVALLNEGKKGGFQIDDVLSQLKQEIGYRPDLQRMFIEIQLYAAYANGVLHPAENSILLKVCRVFDFTKQDFERLTTAIVGEIHHEQQSGGLAGVPSISLAGAYSTLSISAKTNDAEVKRAYRRLMSQHHPDKLVSKGLPEEMMKIAEHRTHEIRQAYERIKEARGF